MRLQPCFFPLHLLLPLALVALLFSKLEAAAGISNEIAILPLCDRTFNLAGSSGFSGSAGWGEILTAMLPEVVNRSRRSKSGYRPQIALWPLSTIISLLELSKGAAAA